MLTQPFSLNGAVIPDKVDLREFLFPVEDIADTRAAIAAAVATALEYHSNRVGAPPTDLSTLFIYYNARRLAGDEREDSGASLKNVMKAVETFGACRELTWPFDAGSLRTQPPAEAYEEGKRLAKIEFMEPSDPFQSLSLKYPLALMMRVVDRLVEEADKTGVMPTMSADELTRVRELPMFATVLVGYDKAAKTFIARNCWGEQWGDNGHCQVPFELVNALTTANAMAMCLIKSSGAAKAHMPSTVGAMDAAAPTEQPESLAALAARMKAEIRGDLQRDLSDATRRARDRVLAPTPKDVGVRGCYYCNFTGACAMCGGPPGCGACNRGRCGHCS